MDELVSVRELRTAGRHEDAKTRLLVLVAQHPRDPHVLFETACVHDSLGLEDEAVPYYVGAMKNGLDGDELRVAYLGLGSTYRALGRYVDSNLTLTEGVESFPDANELKVFLAMTRYNLGEHRAAVESLLRVVAASSDDPAIRRLAPAIRFYAEDMDRTWS